MPLFLVPGKGIETELPSLPGIFRRSLDRTLPAIEELLKLGIQSVIPFVVPEQRDARGSAALDPRGLAQESITVLRQQFPELSIIADVCLCQFTDHGHCGLIENGEVANDPTLDVLARQAVSLAQAGAQTLMLSSMSDGAVAAMRSALAAHGYGHVPIMSQAAKYASAFYGPFRQAAASAPRLRDKTTYQVPCTNVEEALREIQLDIEEGADIIVVKPALAYLDMLYRVRGAVSVPITAFCTSGEYALLKAGAACGALDGSRIIEEYLSSIERAGASSIITYFAREYCSSLSRE